MKLVLALLFVGVCACAEVERRRAPPYAEAVESVRVAAKKLNSDVLSMAGKIPNLSDYRRHYAEIVHVVLHAAVGQSGCARLPLSKVYQKYLNVSSPEAISKPQKVITGVQDLYSNFDSKTEWIREVIRQICLIGTRHCNRKVDEVVYIVGEPLNSQARVLLAGGKAARDYLNKADEFSAVSKKHGSHRYVIKGLPKLAKLIKDVAKFLRALRPGPFFRC